MNCWDTFHCVVSVSQVLCSYQLLFERDRVNAGHNVSKSCCESIMLLLLAFLTGLMCCTVRVRVHVCVYEVHVTERIQRHANLCQS